MKNTVIHCKTQEQFNKVLEIFEEKGWKWFDGYKPLERKTCWGTYNEMSCIDYCNEFGYANMSYYENEEAYDNDIISFEKFLEMENKKEFIREVTIEIPEGYQIDEEKSDIYKGKIVFKKIVPTYDEILKKIAVKCGLSDALNVIIARADTKSIRSFRNLIMLYNVAKYFNGDWIPEIGKTHWMIGIKEVNGTKELFTINLNSIICGSPYFKSEEDAKMAIEILGEDIIIEALTLNH